MLNSLNGNQSLLNMCITRFSVEEIPAKVVDHMFVAFIVVLNQHHSDGARGCG